MHTRLILVSPVALSMQTLAALYCFISFCEGSTCLIEICDEMRKHCYITAAKAIEAVTHRLFSSLHK